MLRIGLLYRNKWMYEYVPDWQLGLFLTYQICHLFFTYSKSRNVDDLIVLPRQYPANVLFMRYFTDKTPLVRLVDYAYFQACISLVEFVVITLLSGIVFSGPSSLIEDPCCKILNDSVERGVGTNGITTYGFDGADGVYYYVELDVECGVSCAGATSSMGIVIFAVRSVQCLLAMVQWFALRAINNSDMCNIKEYNKRQGACVRERERGRGANTHQTNTVLQRTRCRTSWATSRDPDSLACSSSPPMPCTAAARVCRGGWERR